MNNVQKWSVSTALIAVLLVVASWFLLVSPKHHDTDSLKQKTQAQLATNDATVQATDILRAQAAHVLDQKAIITKFGEQVPDQALLPSLVRDLTRAASQSNVDLQSIAPAGPAALVAPAADVSKIPVALVVKGNYFAVETFLSKLEAMPRVVLVTAMTITPDDPASATSASAAKVVKGAVTANISANVFMKAPAPAAAPAAAVPAATPQPAAK